MKIKHTKGPWFALEFAGQFLLQNGEFYEDNCILDCDSFPREEVEANAQLAISAPELLEALQDLVKYNRRLLTLQEVPKNQIDLILKESEAAIKKALNQ